MKWLLPRVNLPLAALSAAVGEAVSQLPLPWALLQYCENPAVLGYPALFASDSLADCPNK